MFLKIIIFIMELRVRYHLLFIQNKSAKVALKVFVSVGPDMLVKVTLLSEGLVAVESCAHEWLFSGVNP